MTHQRDEAATALKEQFRKDITTEAGFKKWGSPYGETACKDVETGIDAGVDFCLETLAKKGVDGARGFRIAQSESHGERSVWAHPSPTGTIDSDDIKQATINLWTKQGRINVECIDVIEALPVLALIEKQKLDLKEQKDLYVFTCSRLTDSQKRVAELEKALEYCTETLDAIMEDVGSVSLEAERLGNKAICVPALQRARQALKGKE